MADSISIKNRKLTKAEKKLKGKEYYQEQQAKNEKELKDMAAEVDGGTRSSKLKDLSAAKKKEMLGEYEQVIKKLKELELRNKKKQDFKHTFKDLKYFTTLNGHSIYSESMQVQAKADKESISAMMAYGQLGAGFDVTFEQMVQYIRPERRQEFLSLCKNNSVLSHNLMGMTKVLQFYNQRDFTRAYAAMVFFGLENNIDIMETFLKVKFNADFKQQINIFKEQIENASIYEIKAIREEAGTNVFSKHDAVTTDMQVSLKGKSVSSVMAQNARSSMKQEKSIFSSTKEDKNDAWSKIYREAKGLTKENPEDFAKTIHDLTRQQVEAEKNNKKEARKKEHIKVVDSLAKGEITAKEVFGVEMTTEKAIETLNFLSITEQAGIDKSVEEEHARNVSTSSASEFELAKRAYEEDPSPENAERLKKVNEEAYAKVVENGETCKDYELHKKRIMLKMQETEDPSEIAKLEVDLVRIETEELLSQEEKCKGLINRLRSKRERDINIQSLKEIKQKILEYLEKLKSNKRYEELRADKEISSNIENLENMVNKINEAISSSSSLDQEAINRYQVNQSFNADFSKFAESIVAIKPVGLENNVYTVEAPKKDNNIVGGIYGSSTTGDNVYDKSGMSELYFAVPTIRYYENHYEGGFIEFLTTEIQRLEKNKSDIMLKIDNLPPEDEKGREALLVELDKIKTEIETREILKAEYIKRKEQEATLEEESAKKSPEEIVNTALKTIESRLKTEVVKGEEHRYIDELTPDEMPERLKVKTIQNIVKKVLEDLKNIEKLDLSTLSSEQVDRIKNALDRSGKLIERIKDELDLSDYTKLKATHLWLIDSFDIKAVKQSGSDFLCIELESPPSEPAGQTGVKQNEGILLPEDLSRMVENYKQKNE